MCDEDLLNAIKHDLLSAAERNAIVACARYGFGEARNLDGILGVARGMRIEPKVVAAAFLYLPVLGDPSRFLDTTDIGPDAFDTADLGDDPRVIAAFALGRKAAGRMDLCPIAVTAR
jgi:hypothetical protein